MGFFTTSDQGQSGADLDLPKLTFDRVKAVVESCDWKYETVDENVIFCIWDHARHFFIVAGENSEILAARGIWNKQIVDAAKLPEVMEFINGWNSTRMFPKTYIDSSDTEGEWVVCFEHVIDYEFGVLDKQIEMHLEIMLKTGHDLCAELDKLMPDAVSFFDK